MITTPFRKVAGVCRPTPQLRPLFYTFQWHYIVIYNLEHFSKRQPWSYYYNHDIHNTIPMEFCVKIFYNSFRRHCRIGQAMNARDEEIGKERERERKGLKLSKNAKCLLLSTATATTMIAGDASRKGMPECFSSDKSSFGLASMR